MNGFQRIALVLLGFFLVFLISFFVHEKRTMDYQPRISLAKHLSENQQDEILEFLLRFKVSFASLDKLKNHLEQISWIHRVYIARKWPSDLILDVRLQEAIAYWNDNGFINPEGEVFVTDHFTGGDLPQLYGPKNTAHQVMNEYQQLNRVLFKAGRAIEILVLNERGAWEFQDYSGIRVLLGKEDIRQRLERSIKVLQEIEKRTNSRQITRVDARYNNGVSIGWLDSSEIANNTNLRGDETL